MIGFILLGVLLGLAIGIGLVIYLAWNMQESGQFFVRDGKGYKPFKSPFTDWE